METEASPIDQAAELFEEGRVGIAKLLAISRGAVDQWARGERPIPPNQAVRIEKQCGFPVEKLCPVTPWLRVPDKRWPNLKGRPVIDHGASIKAKRKATASEA